MNANWAAAALACLLAAAAAAGAAEDPTTFEAGRAAVAREAARSPRRSDAKNAILFLGDGLGLSTVTAARILEGQLRGQPGEENLLAFESFPHIALIKTYNTNQQTPDSAGTMTAIVTGEKTRAGVVSVSRDVRRGDFAAVRGHELVSVLERAEERGLATGIVTTTTVTHATPATLYAHSPERSWESDDVLPAAARAAGFADIARQLVEFPRGDGIEVVLGGGRQHLQPRELADPEYPERRGRRLDGRDLTAEWVAGRENAAFVWNRAQLLAIDPKRVRHLLGLFEPGHMHFEADRAADRAGEPSLSEMTTAAISLLKGDPDGYLLMVEGGRIDHAHHSGNAYHALTDTIEFARAVRAAMTATDPEDTLIVVTADHSHVFTIAGYPTRGNDILGKVVSNDPTGEPAADYSRDALGHPYTTLGYQNGPGAVRARAEREGEPLHQHPEDPQMGGAMVRSSDLTGVDTTDPDFLQPAGVPMLSETHAAEDVATYAEGPGAELFTGVREQHYIYHALVEALGWNRRPARR